MSHLSRRRLLVGAAASAVVLGCGVRTASKTQEARSLRALIRGGAHVDGAGVALTKLLGHRALPMLDPFLMLDRFRSNDAADFARGFPDHPHRGFETVSIVLDGHVRHSDSVGNAGDIAGGGVQWMTAGRGLVHSEMLAASEESGWLSGLQLWVNLPAAHKMRAPRYQDLQREVIPTTTLDDARVRVLAGLVNGVRGPVDGVVVDPTLLDVTLEAGARFRHALPRGHNAFFVVTDGAVGVAGPAGTTSVDDRSLAVLGSGDLVDVTAERASRLLVFAGAPIGEPVARRGPFVMNTDAELRQAFDDFRSGRLAGG